MRMALLTTIPNIMMVPMYAVRVNVAFAQKKMRNTPMRASGSVSRTTRGAESDSKVAAVSM